MRELAYFVGLDLGQTNDFSAIAILERSDTGHYALRHLQRFRLRTSYPQVVQSVRALLQTPLLQGSDLVVDQTGVGRPVVDMFRDALRGRPGKFIPVTITSGKKPTVAEDGIHVPKRELIGAVQVLLQTRRLRIARTLPDAAALVKELNSFRVKITRARNETFGTWRAGQHDDLVLAVALAAWCGEKAPNPIFQFVPCAGGPAAT